MNIEEIKKSIIIDNENELNRILEQMIKTNKLSPEYYAMSNKKNILDKEINKLNTLTEENINKFMNKTELLDDDILIVREHLSNYKTKMEDIKKHIFNGFTIPKSLLDRKDRLEVIKFKSESDIDLGINILEEKISEFETHVNSYYEKIKYFSYIDYLLFKNNLENNRLNLKIDLEKFKNLGVDNIIDRLMIMYDELNTLNNSKFKNKIKDEKIKLLEDRIEKYLGYIIRNIESYVIRSFEIENIYLNLDIEESSKENKNFDKYYKEISEKIKEKYNFYKKTLKVLNMFKNNYIKGIKLSYEKSLINSNVNSSNIKKYTNEDFMDTPLDELDNKIAFSNLKNKILQKEKIRKI
mgnify:FL=1